MPRITRYGYGFFPGGDPRLFHPDEEGITTEEHENHRRACEAWNRGEQESRPDCEHLEGIIITSCQFGLGSYQVTEDISRWEWIKDKAGGARLRLFWALPDGMRRWCRWVLH